MNCFQRRPDVFTLGTMGQVLNCSHLNQYFRLVEEKELFNHRFTFIKHLLEILRDDTMIYTKGQTYQLFSNFKKGGLAKKKPLQEYHAKKTTDNLEIFDLKQHMNEYNDSMNAGMSCCTTPSTFTYQH